jgi:hypothetical protein
MNLTFFLTSTFSSRRPIGRVQKFVSSNFARFSTGWKAPLTFVILLLDY